DTISHRWRKRGPTPWTRCAGYNAPSNACRHYPITRVTLGRIGAGSTHRALRTSYRHPRQTFYPSYPVGKRRVELGRWSSSALRYVLENDVSGSPGRHALETPSLTLQAAHAASTSIRFHGPRTRPLTETRVFQSTSCPVT